MAENILIIGAGAAGAVAAKKCAMNRDIFKNIHLASRTLLKCEVIQKECQSPITISQINADNSENIKSLIKHQKSDIVINLALPYQNLAIMEGCLKAGAHYIDTACFEVRERLGFIDDHQRPYDYEAQWRYNEQFSKKGLMAILGCGFDPGVTNIFTAYAQEKLMDEIHTIDIIDCNDGCHGKAFATNFNAEINIREITQKGRFWKEGKWIEIEPFTVSSTILFPGIGARKAYLIYHEEEESLVKNIRGLKQIRFWMTFSDSYIRYLSVFHDVGLTSIEPVIFQGHKIVPLQFLCSLLPEPASLANAYTGKTSIGCIFKGTKDGKPVHKIIYNVCDHKETHREVKSQAVSYTTGVPAMTAAMMIVKGLWKGKGTFNPEQLPAVPFLEEASRQGLPYFIEDFKADISFDKPTAASCFTMR